jgi:trehalose 6-phosphate synthase
MGGDTDGARAAGASIGLGLLQARRIGLGGRLVAVSNRVARPKKGASPGGLALALSEALAAEGGTWVGWSGNHANAGTDTELSTEAYGNVDYALLDLEKAAFDGFYEGYANGALWPTFHNRADLAVRRSDAFAAYAAVNRSFADAVTKVVAPGDLVWVHDYHFLLLADALRSLGVTNTVGLFLHIPFPHLTTFRTLPEAEAIARALTRYDAIGVQTRRDAGNLAECLAALGEGTVLKRADGFEVAAFGRRVRVSALPIGIDVDALRRVLAAPAPREVRAFRDSLAGRRAMTGVDRLDYSKGLPQKLEAFYSFLSAEPSRASSAVLTQVAPISRGTVRAYADTRHELECVAGRIAGQFGTLSASPLRLVTRAYDRAHVAHLLAMSDVGLVTPTADGMNLVAKEFVAAQDPADPGVLILSEFAGAAEMMTDALIVNPHDIDGMASAMERALAMPHAERRERHRALMEVVEATDVRLWTERCLRSLAAAG